MALIIQSTIECSRKSIGRAVLSHFNVVDNMLFEECCKMIINKNEHNDSKEKAMVFFRTKTQEVSISKILCKTNCNHYPILKHTFDVNGITLYFDEKIES